MRLHMVHWDGVHWAHFMGNFQIYVVIVTGGLDMVKGMLPIFQFCDAIIILTANNLTIINGRIILTGQLQSRQKVLPEMYRRERFIAI